METISGVGKSFEAEPAYREEGEPPIKKRKTEQRKTLTSLSADLQAHIPADIIQKIAKSFPKLTQLNIRIIGKPSQEMVEALDNWLRKENLLKLQTVAIIVVLSESLKVPFTVNLLEKSFAAAIKVIDSL